MTDPQLKAGASATARGSRAALAVLAVVLWMVWTHAAHAMKADFQVFNDEAHFSDVLLQQGRVQLDADWNQGGAIQNGQAFGPFRFAFDPSVVHLAGVPGIPGIVSGLAIGTEDRGTLGGDRGVTLNVTPGTAVTAFGAIIAFNDPIVRDSFRLVVGCPDHPCVFTPAPQDPNAAGVGTFFLGVVADPGFSFQTVMLAAAIPTSTEGSPAGWQIAGIRFAPVAEPSTLALLGAGLAGLGLSRRRSPG